MSSLANPNWLAVGGAFFVMCGSALLVKALIQGASVSSNPQDGQRANAVRQVNTTFGVPLLGIGLLLHAIGQMATASLTPLMVSVMLALAFGMLLYASYEDLMVESLLGDRDQMRRSPRLALLPPASAPEVKETVIESLAAGAG